MSCGASWALGQGCLSPKVLPRHPQGPLEQLRGIPERSTVPPFLHEYFRPEQHLGPAEPQLLLLVIPPFGQWDQREVPVLAGRMASPLGSHLLGMSTLTCDESSLVPTTDIGCLENSTLGRGPLWFIKHISNTFRHLSMKSPQLQVKPGGKTGLYQGEQRVSSEEVSSDFFSFF